MVILGHNLGNSQVSVYRTIGPTLVDLVVKSAHAYFSLVNKTCYCIEKLMSFNFDGFNVHKIIALEAE